MQQVVFRLLGPPEILHKDQLIKIPRRRSRALLYYLVCTQAPQPRERLLTLLCGDVDEESARHTFKTLLAEVRGLLRGFDSSIEWIINDGDQLKLNPRAPLWLDAEIFEKVTAVTSHNLSQAIELYRGDFLDGFFLKDAPNFDTWVRSARDHFHRLYLTTLRRLAELYESENQLEQAITCTQMLLTTDPLLEEAYARLMRLYWTADNRVEAIRQYERLCAVLAQELAVKPSPSTQALYEQITLQRSWSPVSQPVAQVSLSPIPQEQPYYSSPQLALTPGQSPAPAPLPFVGRTAEMEWLQQHLTGPANQYPLLLLQGEAGAGKTCLIQQMCEHICSSWLILRSSCQEIEQAHAYHALVEALRQGLPMRDLSQFDLPGVWHTQLAQLLPDLFPFATLPLERTAIEPLVLADALVALLNQLARPDRPLLLILDDIHWADAATLALLGHLASHVQLGSVFLLGSFCEALAEKRLEPLQRSTARRNALAELTLSLLTTEELEQLVSLSLATDHRSHISAEDRAALTSWCYQRSEGHPLIASAWLSIALKEPGMPLQLPDGPVPAPVETQVKHQLAHLSHDARSLLTSAAFLGSSFDLLAAAQLVHLTSCATIAASNELLQRTLIIEAPAPDSGHYSFAHTAVREVLLAHTSAIQRHLLQRAAQSL